MAIVKELETLPLDRDSKQIDVSCTYSIDTSENGSKCLQIDIYGLPIEKCQERNDNLSASYLKQLIH